MIALRPFSSFDEGKTFGVQVQGEQVKILIKKDAELRVETATEHKIVCQVSDDVYKTVTDLEFEVGRHLRKNPQLTRSGTQLTLKSIMGDGTVAVKWDQKTMIYLATDQGLVQKTDAECDTFAPGARLGGKIICSAAWVNHVRGEYGVTFRFTSLVVVSAGNAVDSQRDSDVLASYGGLVPAKRKRDADPDADMDSDAEHSDTSNERRAIKRRKE